MEMTPNDLNVYLFKAHPNVSKSKARRRSSSSMADHSGPVPLLNQYKHGLLRRRLLQVITGGVNIRKAPWRVHLIQFCLWFSPLIISVPFVVVDALNVWNQYYIALVYAIIMGLYSLVLELCIVVIRHFKGGVFSSVQYDDEAEDIEFTSVLERAAIDFIFSTKRMNSLIIHPFIAGVLSFAGCFLLLSSVLLESLHIAGVGFIFIIGWYTVCSAYYSLCVNAPSEVAIYRTTNTLELNFLMRPFYVLAIGATFVGTRSLVTDSVVYLQVLYSLLCILPLGWAVGFLPPLDALVVWVMEQLLTRLLGGSPMATDLRLLMQFLPSVISVVIITVLTDSTLAVLLSTAFGFILSQNLFFNFGLLLRAILLACPSAVCSQMKSYCSTMSMFMSVTSIDSYRTDKIKVYLFYWIPSVLKCALLLGGGLVVVYFTSTITDTQTRELATNVVGGLLIGLLILIHISSGVQKLYIIGVLRNPLYPWTCDNVSKFKTRRRVLRYFAIPQAVMQSLVVPLLLLSYIGLGLAEERSLVPHIWAWISVSRLLRQTWQNTCIAHRDLSLVALLHFIIPQINISLSFGPATQSLIFGEALTILSESALKLSFAATLFLNFIRHKKHRTHRVLSVVIIVGTFLLLPFVLITILISSILSIPLLALFTLPVFVLSFPRTKKFWPGLFSFGKQYTKCKDSVYYQQCQDGVVMGLQRSMSSGAVSSQPGTQVLVRFDDRMIFCSVLEKGQGFATLYLRGLELQETSCHTVEANRVDEIFDSAYGPAAIGCIFNTRFFNMLQAKDSTVIQTYSDAKNVLTGIIDQASALERFSENLLKSLVWVLFQFYKHHSESTKKDPLFSPQHNSVIEDNVASTQAMQKSPQEQTPVHCTSDTVEDDQSWADSVSTIEDCAPSGPMKMIRLDSDTSIPSLLPEDRPVESREPHGKIEDIFVSPSDINLPSLPVSRSTTVPERKSSRFGAKVQPQSTENRIPHSWNNVPLPALQVTKLLSTFPSEWYSHIKAGGDSSELLGNEQEKHFITLAMVCFSLVDVPTVTKLAGGKQETKSFDVHQGFIGEFPYSPHLSWLSDDPLLKSLVMKAYRYAVKLLYDEACLGELESHSELVEYLEEYDTQYFIGSDTEHEWEKSVLKKVPHLFSIARNKETNVHTAHVLTLQDQVIHIGELNPVSVQAIWADLSLELLFLTNEDDERYSIQAHPSLLRNLTIQAADPPLGYSVYSSGLVKLPAV